MLGCLATSQQKWINILQKCRRNKDLEQAKYLLAHLREMDLETHTSIGNFLVTFLLAFGSLPLTQEAFDKVYPVHRTIISWTSLMSAFVNHGKPYHALDLYDTMLEQSDVQPNRCTYLALLSACTRSSNAERGWTLHSEIVKKGMDQDVVDGSATVGNTLVDMYNKCGWLAEAQSVFNLLPVHSLVSWNVLIAGFCEHGLYEKVHLTLQQMEYESISPDSFTFVCSLKSCCDEEALEMGRVLHVESIKRGLDRQQYVGNALVGMYTKGESLAEAQCVFDALVRDLISWNALIVGYAEQGLVQEAEVSLQKMQFHDGISPNCATFVCILKACSIRGALDTCHKVHLETTKRGLQRELFLASMLVDVYTKCGMLKEAHYVHHSLPVRDVISWNVLFVGLSEQGLDEEVLNCFQQLELEGVHADAGTLVMCLKACGNTAALEVGRKLHAEIRKSGLEKELNVGSTLIGMYGKCGSVQEGWEVFDRMTVRDLVVWNAMIGACGENQEGNMAVECFHDMQGQGVKPDSVTFISLLAACSHSNLLSKGQCYFREMQGLTIEPTVDHYACMIDLFARSGYVCEAQRIIATMQFSPSSVMLKSLLMGCKSYGDVGLGEICLQLLVEADQEVASGCLLMVDVYANACRWHDAHKLEELRIMLGQRKSLGKRTLRWIKSCMSSW